MDQTADVTPRRLQQFRVTPGARYAWENRRASDNVLVASGTVTADGKGLVTATAFRITTDGSRFVLTPAGGGTPANQAPTAAFAASPTSGTAPLPVTFDASGSSDPDGTIASYAWTFGDGTQGSGVRPSHTFSAAGTYTTTLTVTDDRGATASASRTITVTAATGSTAHGTLPLTTSTIIPFSDQLSGSLSKPLVQFIATHFAGTQKMLAADNARFVAANPNWVQLHYRLATTSGPANYIHNGSWGSDWSSVTTHEDWFLHNPDGLRLHNAQWNWDQNDINNPSFRDYWLSSVIADMRATGSAGVVADSFDAGSGGFWYNVSDPRFTGTNAANPSAWPNGVTWVQQLQNWIDTVEAGLHAAPEYFLFVPNIGPLVTSWANIDYSHADGAMLEGFGQWGGGYLQGGDPADRVLSMNRALPLSRADKTLIMQPSLLDGPDTPTGQLHREFLLGTYLLLRGDHTYLNLVDPNSSEGAFWYPEYGLDLGAATTPLPADVSGYLWNGVYRRDFQRGLVLVNPGNTALTLDLGGTYQDVTASGGGALTDASLDANGNYVGGRLSLAPVTRVTLAPGAAAVLLSSGQTTAPAPASGLTLTAGDAQVSLTWTLPTGVTGARVVRRSDRMPAAPTDGVLVAEGVLSRAADTALLNGQAYFYKVFTSTDSAGSRQYSAAAVSPEGTATPRALASGGADLAFTATRDNHLTNFQNPQANLGGLDTLQFYKSGDSQYRPLLGFDLASLPAGATILDAHLDLYHLNGQFANAAMTVNVMTLARAWGEGNGHDNWSAGQGSSWQNADTGVAWATAGGDFNTGYNFGTAANGVVTTGAISAFAGQNWVSFDGKAAVQAWASGALVNNGFAFVITGGNQTEQDFASSEYADASLRPRLVVRYTVSAPAPAPAPQPAPAPAPAPAPTPAPTPTSPTRTKKHKQARRRRPVRLVHRSATTRKG